MKCMRIDYAVESRPDHIPEELIADAGGFAYDYLKVPSSVFLNMEFEDTGDCLGYSDLLEEERDVAYLWLSPALSVTRFLRVMFHELAHIKQLHCGKLSPGFGGPWKWLGEAFPPLPYRRRPWEIEAHKLERKMLASWLTRAPNRVKMSARSVAGGPHRELP